MKSILSLFFLFTVVSLSGCGSDSADSSDSGAGTLEGLAFRIAKACQSQDVDALKAAFAGNADFEAYIETLRKEGLDDDADNVTRVLKRGDRDEEAIGRAKGRIERLQSLAWPDSFWSDIEVVDIKIGETRTLRARETCSDLEFRVRTKAGLPDEVKRFDVCFDIYRPWRTARGWVADSITVKREIEFKPINVVVSGTQYQVEGGENCDCAGAVDQIAALAFPDHYNCLNTSRKGAPTYKGEVLWPSMRPLRVQCSHESAATTVFSLIEAASMKPPGASDAVLAKGPRIEHFEIDIVGGRRMRLYANFPGTISRETWGELKAAARPGEVMELAIVQRANKSGAAGSEAESAFQVGDRRFPFSGFSEERNSSAGFMTQFSRKKDFEDIHRTLKRQMFQHREPLFHLSFDSSVNLVHVMTLLDFLHRYSGGAVLNESLYYFQNVIEK